MYIYYEFENEVIIASEEALCPAGLADAIEENGALVRVFFMDKLV